MTPEQFTKGSSLKATSTTLNSVSAIMEKSTEADLERDAHEDVDVSANCSAKWMTFCLILCMNWLVNMLCVGACWKMPPYPLEVS